MSARLVSATRRLAHLLLERNRAGVSADPEAALRLLDPRLVPGAEDRRRIAQEALALCQTVTSRFGRDERLAGELRSNVRIALRGRDGKPFSVLIPSVVLGAHGTASVLVMAPAGDEGAEARARRYRLAVGRLRGHQAVALLVRPGGLDELPASRSGPSGALNPDKGCSPSGRQRSGRRRR